MRTALPVLAALLALARPAAGETSLAILAPPANTPLFDRVEVRVETTGAEPVERIVVLLDGSPVGAVHGPPWVVVIDTGPENREKVLEVVAYAGGCEVARRRLMAPPIPVDESVELELKQLYATVTDRRGRPLAGLERRRFILRDEGRREEIVTFAGGEIPFTATLLIDGSYSMTGEPLAIARRGAELFIAGMRPLDQARVVIFSDRLREVTPFVPPGGSLGPAWATATAAGGSAILDHLYLALAELESRHGRRVAVLLSDGLDLHSTIPTAELREVARRSQTILYWIRLGFADPRLVRQVPLSSWTDTDRLQDAQQILETIVDESGGATLQVFQMSRVGDAFATILDELRRQYALGYYPSGLRHDGSWRKISLRVAGGHRVRTQRGYYDRPRLPTPR